MTDRERREFAFKLYDEIGPPDRARLAKALWAMREQMLTGGLAWEVVMIPEVERLIRDAAERAWAMGHDAGLTARLEGASISGTPFPADFPLVAPKEVDR